VGFVLQPLEVHHVCTSEGAEPKLTPALMPYRSLARWHVFADFGLVLQPFVVQ
jgi:hypothetical protein